MFEHEKSREQRKQEEEEYFREGKATRKHDPRQANRKEKNTRWRIFFSAVGEDIARREGGQRRTPFIKNSNKTRKDRVQRERRGGK